MGTPVARDLRNYKPASCNLFVTQMLLYFSHTCSEEVRDGESF